MSMPANAAAVPPAGDTPVRDVTEEAKEAARQARLRYVTDQQPGFRREKASDSFRYLGLDGKPITDAKVLERIQKIGVPPAYTDVWICPLPNGHLQATAKDARGRKQYRYHERWRATRDETKYDRMIAFGDALPAIRARVRDDMARQGLGREKVLATLVRLLETTRIRVGNEEYAKANQSFGLTTMRPEHADVHGQNVRFQFKGKSGKYHDIELHDGRVARIVKKLRDLPGQSLFEWQDKEGVVHNLDSTDVNTYLHETAGEEFTAKDFRTWSGTVLCALALLDCEPFTSETGAKKNVVEAIKAVSERLGNTPSVCRKCYIHPAVLERYADGSLADSVKLPADVQEAIAPDAPELSGPEKAVLDFLRTQGHEAHDADKK